MDAAQAQPMPEPMLTDMAEQGLGKLMEEAQREYSQEKLDRERRQIEEDLECWWADRNGGDGKCEKREREARMETCWQSGMYWDWNG